ncbi:MAG: GNAT family N-acetyltransferase [Rhizomicrobium sp.]
MRVEVLDGDAGWAVVEPLDREVYPPEVMATVSWRNVTWAHADKRIIVRDAQGVRCHVGVFWRTGTLNGAPAHIAGIGGVMTSESVRHRGYAGSAMRKARRLMEENEVDFGLLFCEPNNERFYGNLGWTVFDGDVWTEQPEGRVRFDLMHALCLSLRLAPERGVIDLCGLPW